MQTQPTFEKYLLQMKHSSKTIRSYRYAVNNFLAVCPGADKYGYRDVINYMKEKTDDGRSVKTVIVVLAAIKKYYDFLIESGQRMDHPCRSMFLKGAERNRDVIHADLFSSSELELLLKRQERYSALKLKHQALLSILIYQGLMAQEVAEMKLHHVDLDKGMIYVKASRVLAARHLQISPNQYRILDRYINDSRPNLIASACDTLIVGKLGTPITVDDIHYVVSTFKPLFPDRNITPTNIRQSVIANWLNERNLPLEQVQLMAGHKWVSTTLKYRQVNHNTQRELINKWHPLG